MSEKVIANHAIKFREDGPNHVVCFLAPTEEEERTGKWVWLAAFNRPYLDDDHELWEAIKREFTNSLVRKLEEVGNVVDQIYEIPAQPPGQREV